VPLASPSEIQGCPSSLQLVLQPHTLELLHSLLICNLCCQHASCASSYASCVSLYPVRICAQLCQLVRIPRQFVHILCHFVRTLCGFVRILCQFMRALYRLGAPDRSGRILCWCPGRGAAAWLESQGWALSKPPTCTGCHGVSRMPATSALPSCLHFDQARDHSDRGRAAVRCAADAGCRPGRLQRHHLCLWWVLPWPAVMPVFPLRAVA